MATHVVCLPTNSGRSQRALYLHAGSNCENDYHSFTKESGLPTGGQLGQFSPGPSLKGVPGGLMKGTLNTCLKINIL